MNDLNKNWKLYTELHKWLDTLVKKQSNDYEKGYNDAVLDVKNQVETIVKSMQTVSQKPKLTIL